MKIHDNDKNDKNLMKYISKYMKIGAVAISNIFPKILVRTYIKILRSLRIIIFETLYIFLSNGTEFT